MTEAMINTGRCIKQVSNVGYDKFYNVCSGMGDWVSVNWGFFDWFGFAVGTIFTIGVFSVLGAIAYGLISDMIEDSRLRKRYKLV